MLRRIIGLAFGLYGGWKFLEISKAFNIYVSRTGDFQASLMEPEFLMPGLAALALLVGGVLMLLGTRFGLLLATIGTVAFSVFAFAIMSQGADSSLWLGKAIAAGLLIGATMLAYRLPRKIEG
ncbi:MAG: hypothetical protein AAFX02_04170 [Pseudomonadota bacterium]